MNFNTNPGKVYLIVALLKDGTTQYKIGVSKHPKKRLLEIKTANPNDLSIVETFSSKYPYLVETSLKNRFSYKNIDGEWFDLDADDVSSFIETCKIMESNFQVIHQDSTLFN